MRLFFGAVVSVATIAGCIPGFDDCAMKPLAAAPLGAVSVRPGPADAIVAASCASQVDFDGRRYHVSGGDGSWTVEIDDLEPIGTATAANEPAWEDTTVYEIAGVDPREAVAMRYGSGARIAVLMTGEMTAALCPYVAELSVEVVCRQDP